MGRGGHNIKSTEEKRKQGTSRPDRDADRVENIVATLDHIPPSPRHFAGRHKKKWEEVCRLLSEVRVLAAQDVDAVTLYVENWFLASDAYKDLKENGMSIKVFEEKEDGRQVLKKVFPNPAFRQYQDCQKILKPLLEHFGFTPKSRQALKVERKPEKTKSAVMQLLTGVNKKTG